MFRGIVKTGIACAYDWSGAGRWFKRTDPAAMPFIIGYHRVVENFDESARHTIPSMLISTSTFEQHVDWLARRYRIVSLDDLGTHLESGHRFSRPAAAITFDDGYADNYHNAFPILRRKGIPAAAFVVTELIGTSLPQVYDRLYMALAREKSASGSPLSRVRRLCPDIALPSEDNAFAVMTSLLKQLQQSDVRRVIDELEAENRPDPQRLQEMAPMSWSMLGEMQKAGITIGSHTRSHVLLTSERPERVTQEITESKRVLEENLQRPVHHFAYPDGRCTPQTVQAVKAAGYRFAYTICQWRDSHAPMLTIPRKVLWERASSTPWGAFSGAVMSCHANRIFDTPTRCEHDHESVNG
jgi:peptidoglycan/xylan/chitin deacetylase (PgdA/CDA1 family)